MRLAMAESVVSSKPWLFLVRSALLTEVAIPSILTVEGGALISILSMT
ncbi:Uncharacterised protein [Salmonella enterica subsp. enterica serovar Bovismorbificans]|uniref:Uncharacterized protein n=1 Tax=Salmonella enterica subsp. enterica serovar Bovismorbificans TaxID=58097 RepID=A0A655E5U5_SALET|nr:Uncharacterised protein [Salmonella enterica subsp. enterica serovar Bovismorbificans]